jgi:hypothetical protein
MLDSLSFIPESKKLQAVVTTTAERKRETHTDWE